MHKETDFFIDGSWVKPNSNRTLSVINPSTEESICQVTLGDESDLNRAVEAAKNAQPEWAVTSKEERLALLESLLSIYKSKMGEMAQVISDEMGAPISLAQSAQAGAGFAHLRQTIKTLEGFSFAT